MEELPTLTTAELILRVAVAGALGGLVGFEREFSDQPAGLRTHILVSLGAALFTIAGAFGLEAFFEGESTINFDPTRVAAQVVSGIGFLGAGAILREGLNIRGLTTAAALWVTAAIGTAVGLGYWVGAIATTVATVIALYGLKQLERAVFPRLRRGFYRFVIEIGTDVSLTALANAAEKEGALVHSMKIETEREGGRRLVGHMQVMRGRSPEDLATALSAVEGVGSIEWSG